MCFNEWFLDIVQYLVEKGTNINIKNMECWTALMWASKEGYLDIVKYLAYKGADIDIKNNDGDTALIVASKERCLNIVKHLVDKGADININSRGWIALMYAFKNNKSNNKSEEDKQIKKIIIFLIKNVGIIDFKKSNTNYYGKMAFLYRFIDNVINYIIIDFKKKLNTFLLKEPHTDL